MLNLPHAPATQRNREPIFTVLEEALADRLSLLEIASGTGEHAAWMSPRLPGMRWQPSDKNRNSLATIDAHNRNIQDVIQSIHLDVQNDWPEENYEAILCINMIHISPWENCQALMRGAGRNLVSGGLLYLYGPYKKGGAHTAESNDRFDRSLRSQNPEWGVRDMEGVIEEARLNGIEFTKSVAMPSNNFSLLFERC
jgi:hypothetical protein